MNGTVYVDPAYLQEVAGRILDTITQDHDVHVVLEGVVPPNPHVNRRNGKGTTNVTPLLHATAVFAVVLHRVTSVSGGSAAGRLTVIRPGRHGSGALGSYPAALVSPAERRAPGWETSPAGKGKLKDARSAYDLTRSMAIRLPGRTLGVYAT